MFLWTLKKFYFLQAWYLMIKGLFGWSFTCYFKVLFGLFIVMVEPIILTQIHGLLWIMFYNGINGYFRCRVRGLFFVVLIMVWRAIF